MNKLNNNVVNSNNNNNNICSVCGTKGIVNKGTYWCLVCESCHDEGWVAAPYYGDNYDWLVRLDHERKTVTAIEAVNGVPTGR